MRVPGSGAELNQSLEHAGRVADFLEFGELMCLDALDRDESCGGHFRDEHQTPDGEAKRDDENFCHVAAWEYTGDGSKPNRAQRAADFENVELAGAELQMKITPEGLAAEGREGRGPLRHLRRPTDVSPDMSFLEMLDVVNEGLIAKGEEPIAFDHDCREGICGTCGVVINGHAARAPREDDGLPAPHAQLQGRRRR